MNQDKFFCCLSSNRIAEIIATAQETVCYVGPGIQKVPAWALVEVGKRIGMKNISVLLDFGERVLRMGYGDIGAVKTLRDAGIEVKHSDALRSALLIVDEEGYCFTPTPLYLEADPSEEACNAIQLSKEQIIEVLIRLSPVVKAEKMGQATTIEEKEHISEVSIEVKCTPVNDIQFKTTQKSLDEVPPVNFDIVRQVRVFEPYMQYVEMSLTGAAIQRCRLTIPPSIQKLGVSKELESRLRTTFDLIEKTDKLSSKSLEDALNEIRKNIAPSLGKEHGRVVLKAQKPLLEKRIESFREQLKKHQEKVKSDLQKHLDDSKKQIIKHYKPIVTKKPPDALLGGLFHPKPTAEDTQNWLESELDKVLPKAEDLIQNMILEIRYKDVTYETLNRDDFLDSVKKAFPNTNWEAAYNEFKAVGEKRKENTK